MDPLCTQGCGRNPSVPPLLPDISFKSYVVYGSKSLRVSVLVLSTSLPSLTFHPPFRLRGLGFCLGRWPVSRRDSESVLPSSSPTPPPASTPYSNRSEVGRVVEASPSSPDPLRVWSCREEPRFVRKKGLWVPKGFPFVVKGVRWGYKRLRFGEHTRPPAEVLSALFRYRDTPTPSRHAEGGRTTLILLGGRWAFRGIVKSLAYRRLPPVRPRRRRAGYVTSYIERFYVTRVESSRTFVYTRVCVYVGATRPTTFLGLIKTKEFRT